MTQSQSIGAIAQALVAAHAEMPAVPFDATNPFLHNNFASLGAVINVVRPILAKHSLAIMQFATSDEQGRPGVRTRLVHSSGEFMEDTICLEVGEEKGKSKAQVAGSIITYLRRYAQSALLNLYADADTDGAAPAANPSGPKPVAEANKPSVHRAAANAVVAAAKATSAPAVASLADKCKARFLAIIKEKALEPEAWLYAVDKSWILPSEQLKDAHADKFPTTMEAADKALADIQAVCDRLEKAGGMSQEETEDYEAAHLPEPESKEYSLDKRKDEPWRSMLIPKWSKHFKEDGFKTFGELSKEQLWWWAIKWAPTGYKGKPPKQEDVALRAELDKVRDAYGFTEAKQ